MEIYQLEINNIRTKAQEAEGRSDLGKADKSVLAKYRANKADYDYILSFTEQNLQSVRELQQRISNFTITMEYYKNQFGMYKAEGYKAKGAQGSIKVGGKLKKWAELTDTLAASLIGVFDNAKEIINFLEDIKTAITKCRTILVTVPEYHNKEANANAILWFEHDVEDMIKIVKELKKHFGDMKNEFYNQISAENMYSNYNYNSRFLRVIEIRLKFYGWMIDRAFTLDTLDEMGGVKGMSSKRYIKASSGGYYNLFGGSGIPSKKTPSGRISTIAPHGGKKFNECNELINLTPLANIKIKDLVASLQIATKTNDFIDTSNNCYTKNKSEFINIINNKYARYLFLAYLEKNILDQKELDKDDKLKKGITIFTNVLKLLNENANWNDDDKKKIAEIFKKEQIERIVPNNKLKNCKIEKTLSELFEPNSSKPKAGLSPEEQDISNYLIKILHTDFLKELLSHTSNKFYGVLDYDASKDKVINNYIATLPSTLPADTTSTPISGTRQANTNNSNNNKLNQKELEYIKGYTNSIRVGFGKLGIYPSADFERIRDLIFDVEDAIEDVYNIFSIGDEKVDTQIKGLDNYKKFIFTIKKRLDINDVNVNIADDDNLNDMENNLGTLKADYKLMKKLFDNIEQTTKSSTAKEALKELIKEYNNDKESITKIAERVLKNPDYSKKPSVALSLSSISPSSGSTVSASSNTTSSSTTSGTGASPVAASLSSAAGVASNPISNTKVKDLQDKLANPPDWLKDLDARSKQNKDYISNILIRIPNDYPKQYKEVKEQFAEIKKRIEELKGPGNALAKLSDDFQTMTTTLIDIKIIEADLINVKVNAEPRHVLGLGSYIPEPLSLEKKSQAREDTKKINEMVKGMMQNTFFEDRGDKARQEDETSKIFEKIITSLSKDYDPRLTYDEQTLLRKPDALKVFLDKFDKTIANSGITNTITQGQYPPGEYDKFIEIQKKYCRLINVLKPLVQDSDLSAKIGSISSKIDSDNCSPTGKILKNQNKGKGKGKNSK